MPNTPFPAGQVTDAEGVTWRRSPRTGALEAWQNGCWRDDHGHTVTADRVRALAPLVVTTCFDGSGDCGQCGECGACGERTVAHFHHEAGYEAGQRATSAAPEASRVA